MTRSLLAALTLVLLATAAAADPRFWRNEWPETDFTTTSVENWVEILSGGPPKDGIPSVDAPTFIAVAEESRIGDAEPVITVEIDGATPRAYPIRYLTWHEIVNDEIAGIPVAVTFCPLCNSGLTFERRIGDRILSFGVSGKLRNSDMVMYDRETQSWWQQALGEGIVGAYTGVRLEQLPTWMESWAEFKARNPEALVMDEPGPGCCPNAAAPQSAFVRPYGSNPYVNYDSSRKPFLYNGEMPPHDIPALARVVRVGDRAWPVERLRGVETLTEEGVTLVWTAGQASALDGRDIATSRDVGTIRVRDAAGRDLPHDVLFAFAFHAFWPDGEWMIGE